MKLSTSTGDFYTIADTHAERIACYQGTGFRHLNVSMYRDNQPDNPLSMDGEGYRRVFDEMGEAAARIGVRIVLGHAPDGESIRRGASRDLYIRSIKRCIEGFSSLGATELVLHPAWLPDWGRVQMLEENKLFYRELLPTAEQFGVCLLVENNLYKNGLLNSGGDLVELMDALGHPLIGACWDTGHAALVNVDQYDGVMALGDRLRALHVQDNDGHWDRHTAPFMGQINFDPLLHGLRDSGYKGFFNFECDWVMMEGLRRSQWSYGGQPVDILRHPPKHLVQQMVALVHEIGKHMLQSYGLWDEES